MVVCANAQAHTQLCAPTNRSAWTQGPTYTKICKYICTIPAYSHLFSDQGLTANWFNESWHLGKVNQSHWLCFRCRICPEPLLRNKAPHSWLSGRGLVWPQLFLSRHPQLSYQRPCLATQTAKATQQPLEKTETSSWVDGGNDDALLWRRKMIIMQPDLRHLPRIMGQMLCKQALTHHVQLFYEFSIIIPIFTDEESEAQKRLNNLNKWQPWDLHLSLCNSKPTALASARMWGLGI